MNLLIQIAMAIVASLSSQAEPELIAAPVIIDPIAQVVEAPESSLRSDHAANGCRVGWPCAEGIGVEPIEACSDDSAENACVWFAFADGDGTGTSFVVDETGFLWPIHVWETGRFSVIIHKCGGDADCAEKNPMIAEQTNY